MRRDAPTLVAKQVLTILERHACSAQSPPEGVLQVVDPNWPKSRSSRLIALADAQQRSYEFRGADPRRISEFVSAFDPDTFDFAGE
ncbi:MAG TPA: hypothetical protein VGQ22_23670, partial [Steroidobacteraceae bacterium]|nr:hypothetical protein [Steroidobacteraceae bacterium]